MIIGRSDRLSCIGTRWRLHALSTAPWDIRLYNKFSVDTRLYDTRFVCPLMDAQCELARRVWYARLDLDWHASVWAPTGAVGFDSGIDTGRLSWNTRHRVGHALEEYDRESGSGGLPKTDIRYLSQRAHKKTESLLCDSALARLSALTLLIANIYILKPLLTIILHIFRIRCHCVQVALPAHDGSSIF
jgi:hypothetical protein